MSQSPTRYDEKASSSKFSQLKCENSPFEVDKSPVPAHSDDYDMAGID